jgi:hypothetical protein
MLDVQCHIAVARRVTVAAWGRFKRAAFDEPGARSWSVVPRKADVQVHAF